MCYDMPVCHTGIPNVSHKSWSNPYIVVQYTGSQCESVVKQTRYRATCTKGI